MLAELPLAGASGGSDQIVVRYLDVKRLLDRENNLDDIEIICGVG
ncbi:Glycerol-3-phosphate dehydrogenase [Minicystis rosea]|nr:Glycerol-3-phosphate dehydrogenase [Minicystis rosea]